MQTKIIYGLIGYPLTHSFSSGYFAHKFTQEGIADCEYINFPINDIPKIKQIIENNKQLAGFNVTIPYKELIIPFLDKLSDEALEMGAVNTVKISREQEKTLLTGYNTDVYGFKRSLDLYHVPVPPKALILGTGGSSKAVSWVLKKMGCEPVYVSRNPNKKAGHLSYKELENTTLKDFPLIINTTPVGMYPKVKDYPQIPYSSARESHTFFDLIYNPRETLFLKKARQLGCKTINGLSMLEEQAEKAWDIWNE